MQVCDDSSDPMQDSDLSESVWADRATIPSRDDQGPPHFADIGFDAATPRAPEINPALLAETRSFYCLHKHIRERAPPERG